ncbi:MAG: tetratricopeptide repeat protein [Phycisphaerales bacterium]
MLRKTIVTGCLCTAMLICAGCDSSHKTVGSPAGEYHTLSVAPLRDTDAAKRANETGLTHLAAGELDKAAAAFKEALAADVDFGPAHNNLGKVYYLQRDWHKAAWEFEYAGELLPGDPGPHNNLGLTLEKKSSRLDDAIDEYRIAVGLAPDNMQYVGNLAKALVIRGDRTDELHALLKQLAGKDTRADWLLWARQQLAGMGVKYE